MQINADTPEEYISKVPEDRRAVFLNLYAVIRENLPPGFEEGIEYGMIAYSVPHERYPSGYHADPKKPLPFINLALQKNHIALYHMGIYAIPELNEWFITEYKKQSVSGPDMGKSCIRFKKTDKIPFELIRQLVTRIDVQQWIDVYESALRK